MAGAVKSQYPNVRYREHKTRKHGLRFDRYFYIRYRLNGKNREEGVGWSSEGMTALKASGILATLKENIRFGRHPQTVAEMRDMEELAFTKQKKELIEATLAKTTFDTFWKTTYATALAEKKPRTAAHEQGMTGKWILPVLGPVALQEISPLHVEHIGQAMKKAGKSPATIIKVYGIISQVWNLAALRGLVTGNNPAKLVKKPRQDNRRMRFLQPDEAVTLLDALKKRSLDMHDIALVSLFAGLRAGEVHHLNWGDVDFVTGLLYIRDPKNKISRHAFITAEIKEMLQRRFQGQSKEELIFPGQYGQERGDVSDTFERVVEEIGLNKGVQDTRLRVVFHTLRHTFASWLVQRGTPLYTVAELMGHTTLEMTRRYSHLAPDAMKAAANGLSGILERKSTKIIQFDRFTQR